MGRSSRPSRTSSCRRPSSRSSNSARMIGRAVPRVEDLRFLRGDGQYVADLCREGMLHAVFLRSAVAHGELKSLRVAAAKAARGVHAVYTAADVRRMAGGRVPTIPVRLAP